MNPADLARELRRAATTLETNGAHAVELVNALAARGYPASTIGDGSRSASDTTSTERAAGANRDTAIRNEWGSVEQRLTQLIDLAALTAGRLEHTIGYILEHASDADWLPAGTGNCECCTNFIRPDHKHPERRLRAGLCPACHQAWLRYIEREPHPDRFAFIRDRRADLLARANERERKAIRA